jgi:hypothetical protein
MDEKKELVGLGWSRWYLWAALGACLMWVYLNYTRRGEYFFPIAFYCFIIGSAHFIYRSIAKLLFRKLWGKWYVRRAIDTSFIGLCLLLILIITSGGSHMPEEMVAQIRPIISSVHGHYPSQYFYLETLTDFKWLLDNLALYTLLPAFAVAFIGYSIERGTEKTQSTTKP